MATKSKYVKPVRASVRMPPPLLEKIKSIARRERRPYNEQLLMLIEKGLTV